MFFISGPCLVESEKMVMLTASHLRGVYEPLGLQWYFKGSYRKANRTSEGSFTGIGDVRALEALAAVRAQLGVPVLTDVHEVHEVELAAKYVDVLQIPAFLARQTDLLHAAGRSGCIVNIKKAQFMAPEDVVKAVEKTRSAGASTVWVTERGTSFGYHNLVVDFRGLVEMKQAGCTVVYDATHSLQRPSIGATSGGDRHLVPHLARAAAAVGVDGVFFETHPNPEQAMSDAATQLPLSLAADFVGDLLAIDKARLACSLR
jgi:2-dehydro-3-deoxyphosphooctonate aldolase (KDO 8-P synthase)